MSAASPNPRTLVAATEPEGRRKADLIATLREVDYPLTLGDLSALDIGALRQESGFTTRDLLQAMLKGSTDLDMVAVVVWLSRRTHGEYALPYVAVATDVTFDDFAGVALKFAPNEPVEDDEEGPLDPPQ